MKRLRTRLASLSPAVVALFALAIAVPRPAVFSHEHEGSEQAHTHSDAESLAELFGHHHHHDAEHHHHRHHHDHDAVDAHTSGRNHHHPGTAAARPSGQGAAGATTLAVRDGSARHSHEQLRFHRGAISVPLIIAAGTLTQSTPQLSPVPPAHVTLQPRHARGPPDTDRLT